MAESTQTKTASHGFSAYKNYLLGYDYLLEQHYPTYSDLKSKISVHQRNTLVDESRVRGLLFNAWNSELLLNLPLSLSPDFVRFSNHWSPVQSYYAIYLSIRALIVAKNMQVNGDHTKTLNVCASNFIGGQRLFPYPWNILAVDGGFTNLPENYSPSEINALENPYHFRNDRDKLLSNTCMFIKTTRERIIDEHCEEWKEKNPTQKGKRLRLPNGQREKIAARVRSISIFDSLYRLRKRSNYQDVDIFILGSGKEEAGYYLKAICNITDKTLFMVESYIAQAVGKLQFQNICSEYINSVNIETVSTGQSSISKRIRSYAEQ